MATIFLFGMTFANLLLIFQSLALMSPSQWSFLESPPLELILFQIYLYFKHNFPDIEVADLFSFTECKQFEAMAYVWVGLEM